jgi:hypothetical protein
LLITHFQEKNPPFGLTALRIPQARQLNGLSSSPITVSMLRNFVRMNNNKEKPTFLRRSLRRSKQMQKKFSDSSSCSIVTSMRNAFNLTPISGSENFARNLSHRHSGLLEPRSDKYSGEKTLRFTSSLASSLCVVQPARCMFLESSTCSVRSCMQIAPI